MNILRRDLETESNFEESWVELMGKLAEINRTDGITNDIQISDCNCGFNSHFVNIDLFNEDEDYLGSVKINISDDVAPNTVMQEFNEEIKKLNEKNKQDDINNIEEGTYIVLMHGNEVSLIGDNGQTYYMCFGMNELMKLITSEYCLRAFEDNGVYKLTFSKNFFFGLL